jgi:DNA-binding protein H-NS
MNIKALNLASLSIKDLTRLHEEIGRVLAGKLESEKRKLEKQLAELGTGLLPKRAQILSAERKIRSARKLRRAYPPVRPKFRNPAKRSES